MSRAAAIALLLAASLAPAQETEQPAAPEAPQKVVAVRGGTVLTMAGAPIEGGTVLIVDGKISAVGADVETPEGAEVIDATGKTVMPGLVDSASRLYLWAPELSEGGTTPNLKVYDGLDTYVDTGEEALRHGVTSVQVLPGVRALIGGQSVVVKTWPGEGTVPIVKETAALRGQIGIPGGNATSSLERLASYTSLREALLGARDYLHGWDKYERQLTEYQRKTKPPEEEKPAEGEETPAAEGEKKPEPPKNGDKKKEEKPDRPKKPGISHTNEVLAKVLRGEMPLEIEAHRVVDILNALRLKDEFGVNLVLVGCSEGHKVADRIAEAGVAVIVTMPTLGESQPSSIRYGDQTRETAAKLAAAGVPVVLAVGGSMQEHSKLVRAVAATAVGNGLDRTAALEAVTSRAAEVLGVGDRIGTLAEGRDGDIVIINGDPLDVRAPVEVVLVDGEVAYERGADG